VPAAFGGGMGDGSGPSAIRTPSLGGGIGDGSGPSTMREPSLGGGMGDGSGPSTMREPSLGGGMGDGSGPSAIRTPSLGGGMGDGSGPSTMREPSFGGGIGDGAGPSATRIGPRCTVGVDDELTGITKESRINPAASARTWVRESFFMRTLLMRESAAIPGERPVASQKVPITEHWLPFKPLCSTIFSHTSRFCSI
jgi:hypothetical protein